MKYWLIIAGTLSVMGVSMPTAQAAMVQSEQSSVITKGVDDDAYVAGNSITVSAPIHGELMAAGNTVAVGDTVDRSIVAFGNTITINKGSGYNTFSAGNSVTLHGTYAHDVFTAGNDVTIAEDATIQGNLYVAGNIVSIHGAVVKDVFVSAGTFESNATIGGSVTGTAETIVFTGGSIAKDLTYYSNAAANGLDTTHIGGTTTRHDVAANSAAKNGGALAITLLLTFCTILLVGAIGIISTPKTIERVTQSLQTNWATNAGIGLVGLLAAPVAALIAFMTVIGWPIGLIILAIWFIGLYVSAISGIIAFGAIITRIKPTNWWLALAVGALAVLTITRLPIVGSFIRLIVFVGLTVPAFGVNIKMWKENLLQ